MVIFHSAAPGIPRGRAGRADQLLCDAILRLAQTYPRSAAASEIPQHSFRQILVSAGDPGGQLLDVDSPRIPSAQS